MSNTRTFGQGRGGWWAGGLLALALLGCEEKKIIGPTQTYTGPIFETTNVLALVSDSARLKFRLTAPLEQVYETQDRVYPKGVAVTFYSKDGKAVVNTLTARYGKLTKATNIITMRGDVRVANVVNQEKLFTEELFFDQNKRLIYTTPQMFVKIETPTTHLTGTGLTANQDFSYSRITHPEGEVAVDPAAP